MTTDLYAPPASAPALLHHLVAEAVGHGAAEVILEVRPAPTGREMRAWLRLPGRGTDLGALAARPVPEVLSGAAESTRDALLRLAGIDVVGEQERAGSLALEVDGEPVDVRMRLTPTRGGGRITMLVVRGHMRSTSMMS